jgi:hypothetical protein
MDRRCGRWRRLLVNGTLRGWEKESPLWAGTDSRNLKVTGFVLLSIGSSSGRWEGRKILMLVSRFWVLGIFFLFQLWFLNARIGIGAWYFNCHQTVRFKSSLIDRLLSTSCSPGLFPDRFCCAKGFTVFFLRWHSYIWCRLCWMWIGEFFSRYYMFELSFRQHVLLLSANCWDIVWWTNQIFHMIFFSSVFWILWRPNLMYWEFEGLFHLFLLSDVIYFCIRIAKHEWKEWIKIHQVPFKMDYAFWLASFLL